MLDTNGKVTGAKFHPSNWRHQAVTHRFCGHARLIRDEENGSTAHGLAHSSGRCCAMIAVFHRAAQPATTSYPSEDALNAYVIPFEQLGMRDVETRRRQERLARRDDRRSWPGSACSVPGGFATTAHAYREFLAQGGLTRASAPSCRARRRRRRASSPRSGARIRQLDPGDTVSAARSSGGGARRWQRMSGGDDDRGRGALLGDRRGSAGCLVRRPAGDLPQRARRGGGAARDARGVRLAVQRPRHLLPRAPGLRSRRGGAVGRRAAHGAQRPGRERRHVHARHRIGIPRRGVHHRLLRARRDRGAGRGQPGRVLRLQAGAARRQAARSCAATSAARRVKMVYAARRAAASACRPCDVPPAERAALLPQRCRRRSTLARQALIIEEHYGRPMDIEWGTRRRQRRDLHPAGASGDRAEPRRPHDLQRYSAQGPLAGARHRPQPSASASAPAPRAWCATPPRWRACRPATCWSPT